MIKRRSTVQHIQFIIISAIYCLSNIFLLGFSLHTCIIDCWIFCLHRSYQRSLILKLVPRQLFYGIYTNQTFLFSSPAGMWKVVARVSVGCLDLFTPKYWFAWSKIFFKLSIQDFFYWILTYVYFIYWIIVHWSWNVS